MTVLPILLVVDIVDGVLRGRHVPSRLRQERVSQDEWDQLRHSLYDAIRPVLWYKQMILIILMGILAVPLLAFGVLLGLVETGYLVLQDKEYNYYDNNNDNENNNDQGDLQETTTEEDALQLVLVMATCGCLALGVLLLVLGSAIRVTTIQTTVETQLASIANDWTSRLKKCVSKDESDIIRVRIVESHINTHTSALRRAFFAWCDVDYVLVISKDDDDSSMGSDFSQETPQQQDLGVYERL